jgi:type I restriction enzyme S subunit
MAIEDCCEAVIDYRGRTPPHITSANVRDGKIDWRTAKYVTEETYSSYMTRGIPRPDDVLFTMEAPLGEAAVLTDDRQFSLAQRTLLLRPKVNLLDGEYLAAALRSPQVKEVILSQSTGTTVKGIASKRLKRIAIPVPPLDTQRATVAILDRLRSLRIPASRIQAVIAPELDGLASSILSAAFHGTF